MGGLEPIKCGMARPPLFLDDPAVVAALDEASAAALCRLAALLPELDGAEGIPFREQLRAHLAALLTGHPGTQRLAGNLPPLLHGDDAFGDRFSLDGLPLPRTGTGYAVQMLDTDTLLDRNSGNFLAVRHPALDGLFESFDSARVAARTWLQERNASLDQYPLAVVPALYDSVMQRHVLVYGVLNPIP